MQQFKTVDEVHRALDEGKTVYAHNTAYKVYRNADILPERTKMSAPRQYSLRNNTILEVRCIENYFGSIMEPSDLHTLFTVGDV